MLKLACAEHAAAEHIIAQPFAIDPGAPQHPLSFATSPERLSTETLANGTSGHWDNGHGTFLTALLCTESKSCS